MHSGKRAVKATPTIEQREAPLEADPFSIIGAFATPIRALVASLKARKGAKK